MENEGDEEITPSPQKDETVSPVQNDENESEENQGEDDAQSQSNNEGAVKMNPYKIPLEGKMLPYDDEDFEDPAEEYLIDSARLAEMERATEESERLLEELYYDGEDGKREYQDYESGEDSESVPNTRGTYSTFNSYNNPSSRGTSFEVITNGDNQDENGEMDGYYSSGNEDESSVRTSVVTIRDGKSIEIVRDFTRKPFLGGVKNRKTGKEYHNATSQTPPPIKSPEQLEYENRLRFHRETQTSVLSTRSTQDSREMGTQMSRIGVFAVIDDPTTQKVIAAKEYYTADQLEAEKWQKAIKIQTTARQWLARKEAKRLREIAEGRRKAKEEESFEREEEEERLRREDIERRKNPMTKEDFELQYANLEALYQKEKARIYGEDLTPEERKEALAELLTKQTNWLQTIDALRMKAKKQRHQQRIEDKLKKMASAKIVVTQTMDQDIVQVHTKYTLRAKELRELYVELKETINLTSPNDEGRRMELLARLRNAVKEFDCRLTRDITELIGREEVQILRGCYNLNGLRKRMQNLFLQFMETPEFNPEAGRYQRVQTLHSNTQPILKPLRNRLTT